MEFRCTKSELFSAILVWRQVYESNPSTFEGSSLECAPQDYAESTVNMLGVKPSQHTVFFELLSTKIAVFWV